MQSVNMERLRKINDSIEQHKFIVKNETANVFLSNFVSRTNSVFLTNELDWGIELGNY